MYVVQWDGVLSMGGAKLLLYNLNVSNNMRLDNITGQILLSPLKTLKKTSGFLFIRMQSNDRTWALQKHSYGTVHSLSSSSMSSSSPRDHAVQYSTASMRRIYGQNHPV